MAKRGPAGRPQGGAPKKQPNGQRGKLQNQAIGKKQGGLQRKLAQKGAGLREVVGKTKQKLVPRPPSGRHTLVLIQTGASANSRTWLDFSSTPEVLTH